MLPRQALGSSSQPQLTTGSVMRRQTARKSTSVEAPWATALRAARSRIQLLRGRIRELEREKIELGQRLERTECELAVLRELGVGLREINRTV